MTSTRKRRSLPRDDQAVRHGASDAPLRLNGEDLKLVSVHINDEPWTAWKEEEGALVISNLPERFTLKTDH
ncbi:hypothetical protein ACLK15_05350 [Escherichia coli]